MSLGLSPYAAPAPRIAPDADPLLAELCRIASAAAGDAWARVPRDELARLVADGADGTPSYLVDELVEAPLVQACARLGVNLLSEEAGFVDQGSARTVVMDPLDGSANAAYGVPLSCFAACLLEDGVPVSALICWLENGATVSAAVGAPTPLVTSGRQTLDGAAVGLLRPKAGERGESARGWWAIQRRAARVRILSSSCLEAMLVAQGCVDAFADPGSDTHRIVDLAAARVIVTAAGGAVRDVYGRPFTFAPDLTLRWSGVVAASAPLADEIADAVAHALPNDLGAIDAAGRTFRLRRARAEDVDAVAALLAEDEISAGSGDATDADRRLRVFRDIDADPRELLVVALDEAGAVVATVQYTLLDTIGYAGLRRAQLEGVGVVTQLRGAGLGRALLGWAVDRARADGAGVMQLTSNRHRDRALAFYRRMGFEHTHAGLKLVL